METPTPPQQVRKHVYHYFAEKNNGITSTLSDGILYMESPVIDMAGYRLAKQLLAGEGADTKGWVIKALNYLGLHSVSAAGPYG